MKILLNFVIVVLLLVSAAAAAHAQPPEINEKFRAETIDSLLALLKDKYVYPEMALKMEEAVRARQRRGEYDAISDPQRLAEKMTADLREVFDDKHLKISYSPEPIPLRSAKAGAPTPAEIEARRVKQRRENFGLQRVEILKGNVGLIQIDYFAPLEWSEKSIAAAMSVAADTDALIIDVRQNRGSMDINAIPFFCSYLFAEPVQLGSYFSRETGETRQLWTYAVVPGRKFADKPVYLLTSRRTASGAEAFVSNLKRLKRAVIVGETTAGATMPGLSHRINEHFSVWISTGRSANGSAANENKGIAPDFPVAPEKAVETAHQQILKQLLETATDENWKAELKNFIIELEKKN